MNECIEKGVQYIGTKYSKHTGRPNLLKDSNELNILSDCMENRLGPRYTTALINCHNKKHKVLMQTITWTRKNNYLHRWLLPFNGLQYGTPYARRLVVNSPEFMPLDNSLNRDILHSFRFHCVLCRFVLKGEGNNEEGKK